MVERIKILDMNRLEKIKEILETLKDQHNKIYICNIQVESLIDDLPEFKENSNNKPIKIPHQGEDGYTFYTFDYPTEVIKRRSSDFESGTYKNISIWVDPKMEWKDTRILDENKNLLLDLKDHIEFSFACISC